MFKGAIPTEMAAIVHEHVAAWDVPQIQVGCSGTFKVERTLADSGIPLAGNDVTLYSCALGRWLAGQEPGLRLKDDARLEWLGEYVDTPDRQIATMLLGSADPGPFRRMDSESPYYVRMRNAYRAQWPVLHEKTLRKLENVSLKLSDFHACDAVDLILSLPDDVGIVTYPPFWAGGYEAQFKALDEVFEWDAPEYPMLDDDRMALLVESLAERPHWLFGSRYRWERLEERLLGMVQTTNRNLPLYVYGNGGPRRVSRPQQTIVPVTAPRLGQREELGAVASLAILSGGQFSALRSQYMNAKIKPAAPILSLALMVDGKLVGAFAYAGPGAPGSGVVSDGAYLLSDFPVAPTRYKRLSRLIVAAAMSREAQRLCQRSLNRRVHEVATTAFTDKPASMKYRGAMKLVKRAETENGGPRYMLNYVGELGRWTVQEALMRWKSEHAKMDE